MRFYTLFAISFILKLLSRGSFICRIRRNYGQNFVSLIHRLDNLTHKYVKFTNDIAFLNKCIQLNVTPRFVCFKTANVNLRQSDAYTKSQRLLLKEEIRNKHREKGRVSLQIDRLKIELFAVLKPLDSLAFRLWLSISARKFEESVKSIHCKKLSKLSPYFNVNPLKPDEVILNLSSHILSNEEKNVLVYGLNYTLATSDCSSVDFVASLEIAARNLKCHLTEPDAWNESKRILNSAIPRFVSCNRNDKVLCEILRNLGKRDDLYISKPDKGNGVVILNRSEYVTKMSEILSDNTKFIPVNDDCYKLSQGLEARLNKVLLTFFKCNKIDKLTYNNLRAVGSYPGKLYGLPKTHKSGVPVRPILSAVTCHNYKLAKFLVPLLTPIAYSEHTVSDVFQFAKEMQQRTDMSHTLLVSLDIESLFTNVPVAETIDIILSKLFLDESSVYHGFTRTDFKTLLKLAVEDSYFSFNSKLYKQIDGMAMGSPLGPLFANIFLSHFESQWLNDLPVKPLLYRRYVDDTLWIFPENTDITQLLTYMNSRHGNMKFTHELESNNSISFIGLTISHNECNGVHGYLTSVYRKPTFTGLFTNYNSFTPLLYRLSVFKCLIYRAFKLCSNWSLFHDEITHLKSILLRNAYPLWILDRIVKRSIDNFLNYRVQFGPRKERIYVGLPFLGKSTDNLRRAIKQIAKQFLPQKEIITYFKPGKRISNFFQIKDGTPFDLQSHIVYEYTCAICHYSYIGQTTRHIRHRVAEHAGVSHLTGTAVKNKVHSSIRDHCSQCMGSNCSSQNFKILARGSTELELLIKERLLIQRRKPALNANAGSFELLLS